VRAPLPSPRSGEALPIEGRAGASARGCAVTDEAARAAACAVIDARAPVWLAPPLLQPAAVYLELSGEDIRRRAFLIDDHGHGELCLRPDMTVPAVRAAYAMTPAPALVAYDGLVFRQQAPGSARESEFVQVGAEWLSAGAPNVAEEAAIIACALEAARATGAAPQLKLGDVALVSAFVDALGLAEPWPRRVRRALARPGGLAALRAAPAHAVADSGEGVAEALAQLSPDHAEAALADLLALARITPVGRRPLAEIAERLRQRGRLAAAPPPSDAHYELLDQLTHIDSADGAARAAKLAASKALQNGAAKDAVAVAEQRLAELKKLIELPKDTPFAPGLGRTLAYYDGFVFELEAPALGERASLGGGGRYDGLARALWPGPGAEARRAAGFALRPARLAEAAP
jgi:ATP phosphoribosyltransferase regulatory subunit